MNSDMLPMLAGRSYQEVPVNPVNEVAEVKLDGWRTIIHIANGSTRLYGGRNGSDYSGRLPYLEAVLEALPKDTVLDGELVSSEDWGVVQSVMTTQQPHQPTKLSPAVNLYLFDVLRVDGQDVRDLRWSDRRRLVEAVPPLPYVRPMGLLPATNEMLAKVLGMGFEGLVIKDPNSRYVNKRSNAWEKIKPQLTTEARIVGFKAGKLGGAYEGMVGAFEVELLDNGAHTTVKCGTDARHKDATEHPEHWLGAIIEIRHHGISKDGIPRHPQFSRVRTDLERRSA